VGATCPHRVHQAEHGALARGAAADQAQGADGGAVGGGGGDVRVPVRWDSRMVLHGADSFVPAPEALERLRGHYL
jgi:hypothetical protein